MQMRHTSRREIAITHLGKGQPWLSSTCEQLRWLPEHPNGRVLIAEEDGEPRAILGLEMTWAASGRLRKAIISVLAVDPEQDHRGIGSRLVRFAEGIARINGCRNVGVSSALKGWGCGHCWGVLGYDDPGQGLQKTLQSPSRRSCA
jgi:GNAT superfamily N-acetyltransferase